LFINHKIRAQELFLIDHQGNTHSRISLSDALRLANEAGLDLVEVNPTATPPVCKIIDYGQYQYQQTRKQQDAKQKTHKVETKGIRLSFKIGKGDLVTRQKQTEKFLSKGHHVRIEMILHGRERQHVDLGKKIINDFVDSLEKNAKIEQPLTYKGNSLSVVINA